MLNTNTSRTNPSLKKFKEWRAGPDLTIRTAMDLLECLNTPKANKLFLLLKYQEYDQVVTDELSISDYLESDVERFYDDLIASSLLRKAKFVRTSFDKKGAALQSFREAEQRCGQINAKVLAYGDLEIPRDHADVHNALLRKISRILGSFDIDYVLGSATWGPGVTQSVKGCDTSATRKFDIESEITRDAYDLFGDVCRKAYPSWVAWNTPVHKAGNVVITVPKNAKTDRTIAVEPGLNVWLQLGIGKLIRRRLGFAGFNLNSDLKNHRQAYIGSLDDSVATVDFKAASDTISVGLVRSILPPIWFQCLDAARSHFYTLEGKTIRSQKFSTMGNGFTFELESLIFVSLALALCECRGYDDSCVSIFGDDLTLPSKLVPELTAICSIYGFTVNADKTFAVGPFRESCGCYYFNGCSVKPSFLKEIVNDTKSAYRLCNTVKALAHARGFYHGLDGRLRPCYNRLLSAIPRSLHFYGPASGGDSVIHANLDECQVRRQGGLEGFFYSGFPAVACTVSHEGPGRLLAGLRYRAEEMPHGNLVPLRAKTRVVFSKRLFAHSWYDFGVWISQ